MTDDQRMLRLLSENRELRRALLTAATIILDAVDEADGRKPRAVDPVHARQRLRLVGSDQ